MAAPETRGTLKVESRIDVMLALLGAAPRPIHGITRLVKLLYLGQQEARADTWLPPSEHYYGYRPYKYGPFSADIYEDVELLVDSGLLQSRPGGKPLAEELAEWREAFADDTLPEPGPESYESEVPSIFRLTDAGRACAESLLESLPRRDRDALAKLRDRYDSFSLRDLLVYVYTRYEGMAEKSEIKKDLGLE
jgi:hypothetical protein